MITPADVGGAEETARWAIILAHRAAPCLHQLVGDKRLVAISIIQAIQTRLASWAATDGIAQREAGLWSWKYLTPEERGGAIQAHELQTLADLCGQTRAKRGLPRGAFPRQRPPAHRPPEVYETI